MAPYSTSGLCYDDNKTLCIITIEMNRCAAKELCICKTAGVSDGRHACPGCQCNVHAICDELCKDAGLFITQPVFHYLLDTNGLLKALTTSSIMLVSLQLLIDKKFLHIV
jgi:hypothetical protein